MERRGGATVNDEIKEKLIKFRKDAGLTQKNIAEKLGISESYYCQLENGNRRMPLQIALDISAILNKTPNDIFLASNFPKRRVDDPDQNCA